MLSHGSRSSRSTSLLVPSLLASLILATAVWAPGQTYPPQFYEATIYRDELGIGHVYGNTDPDVAYGIGRLLARDKALRTYLAMTLASGRSAEVFGREWPVGADYWLKLDRMVRAYNLPAQAQALWTAFGNANDQSPCF